MMFPVLFIHLRSIPLFLLCNSEIITKICFKGSFFKKAAFNAAFKSVDKSQNLILLQKGSIINVGVSKQSLQKRHEKSRAYLERNR